MTSNASRKSLKSQTTLLQVGSTRTVSLLSQVMEGLPTDLKKVQCAHIFAVGYAAKSAQPTQA